MESYNVFAIAAPGIQEMVVIFLIVLLLFGAKKVPELARGIGRGWGELINAKREIDREINEAQEQQINS